MRNMTMDSINTTTTLLDGVTGTIQVSAASGEHAGTVIVQMSGDVDTFSTKGKVLGQFTHEGVEALIAALRAAVEVSK